LKRSDLKITHVGLRQVVWLHLLLSTLAFHNDSRFYIFFDCLGCCS